MLLTELIRRNTQLVPTPRCRQSLPPRQQIGGLHVPSSASPEHRTQGPTPAEVSDPGAGLLNIRPDPGAAHPFYGSRDGFPSLLCFTECLGLVSINSPIRFNDQWDGIGLAPLLYRVMDLAPMANRPRGATRSKLRSSGRNARRVPILRSIEKWPASQAITSSSFHRGVTEMFRSIVECHGGACIALVLFSHSGFRSRSSCSASARSFVRPVERLFKMRSRTPITGIAKPSHSIIIRFFQASSNSIPSTLMRISILIGATPI